MNTPAPHVAGPVNILLVDDQPARLLTYRAILEPLGERLVEARSGTEALRLLMEEDFALILLDVNMPGMDGFETASVIHQHPRFERTPIIFVTAVNVTDMDRLRGYKLGAVDYVMVPVIPEILRSKVMVLAELHRKRRELEIANAALEVEKARELDRLNASLSVANAELASRNEELQTEVAERKEAERRLRFLADTIPSMVWTCTPDGTIDFTNRNWLQYYGSAAGPEHLGRLPLHSDDRERVQALVALSLSEGEPFEFEARHCAEGGGYSWFVTRAVPWHDAQGKIESWFGITTSVHEMKEMMEQLREADRRKDEFLATLAHELRNPLAPLLNAVNLRRMSPEGAADPLQDMMERQLRLLVRLIDDLLDIARITRGKLVLRKAPTTLADVVSSALETVQPSIQEGRHQLEVRLPADPVPLNADAVRLSQLFANLLNNAAKYSEPGAHIELVATASTASVDVLVRDTGIGLSEDQAACVFDLFAQADTSIERSRGGLGIGLTLVRRLAEMHGGSVSVHSEGLGHGSEFRVSLPRHEPVPQATVVKPPPATTACATTPGHRLRALVLDDNRDAADTLAMMLELMDFDVATSYSSADFEQVFAALQPDVVFLDIGMPGRSGYDVAAAVRSNPDHDHVVLVAVTGWGQPEDLRRTQDAGFNHHLVKPPELDAIEAICATLARPASEPVK